MLIIDRFEGEYAVCEDSETEKCRQIPRVFLPRGAKDGDCLISDGHGGYLIDGQATLQRRARIQAMLEDLYN